MICFGGLGHYFLLGDDVICFGGLGHFYVYGDHDAPDVPDVLDGPDVLDVLDGPDVHDLCVRVNHPCVYLDDIHDVVRNCHL